MLAILQFLPDCGGGNHKSQGRGSDRRRREGSRSADDPSERNAGRPSHRIWAQLDFVELEGGRILHFGGSSFTTSDDGGITWSKPFTRKDTNGKPIGIGQEPSLVRLSGKGIGLAARVKEEKQGSNFEWIRSNHMVFWRSEDGGETWQPPVRITPVGVTTASYQDVFLRTSSGRIVLPVFHYLGQRENGWMDVDPPANG